MVEAHHASVHAGQLVQVQVLSSAICFLLKIGCWFGLYKNLLRELFYFFMIASAVLLYYYPPVYCPL